VTSSFHLGSIRGIRIGINWSLLVIFAVIVWTLSQGIFPEQNPGLANGTYVGMAAAAAVLFFASILAHELGHAFVAQREGMQIEGITLWLFGGVARFRGEFPSAGAELRIAVAGPLVSLLIGLASVGIAWAGLPDAIDGVASWLGYINLLLLVFNLLPALPLDGGRILRAILWHARKDFVWATRLAARAGQVFGVLMIGGGLALVVWVGAFSGAWLAFIGWFLLTAAGDERRAADRFLVFGDRTVGDLMVRDPIVVPGDVTVERLVDAMTPELEHATYPVVDDGRAVGLLQLARLVEAPRAQWEGKHVRDFALPLASVTVLRPETPLGEAAAVLGNGTVGRALVLDGERLVGLLSITDIVRSMRSAV
jgi:Zn-dependent protease